MFKRRHSSGSRSAAWSRATSESARSSGTGERRAIDPTASASSAISPKPAKPSSTSKLRPPQGSAIRINLNGLPDVTIAVQKLHIEGAALEPREIFDLIAFLDRAADAALVPHRGRGTVPAARQRAPEASAISVRLLKEVEGKIQADGTVLDSASPHLHRLRRDIEKQKKGIQDSLERFLRANRNEGVLQEEYVTIRNDRFVVPVISGQRRKLPGVIHGASSTGQTLFLEPLETIDLNNELVRLQEEESREVFRILRELTARLRVYGEPIRAGGRDHGRARSDLRQGEVRHRFRLCRSRRFSDRLCISKMPAIRC